MHGSRITAAWFSRAAIKTKKMPIVTAGRSGQVAALADMRLPIESYVLQAFVTEGLKLVIDHVVSFGIGHLYISPSIWVLSMIGLVLRRVWLITIM